MLPNPAAYPANYCVTFWSGTATAAPIITNCGTLFAVPGYGTILSFQMGGSGSASNVVTLMVHPPYGSIPTNNWGCE
jgi:hypothetical protein